MNDRDPFLVVLKDFLPRGTVRDLTARVEETDWNGFFESMFAIGIVLTVFSTTGFLLLYTFQQLVYNPGDVVATLSSLLINLTFVIVLLYLPFTFLLDGINSVAKSEYPTYNNPRKLATVGRAISGHPLLMAAINAALLAILVTIVVYIRIHFVIGDVPAFDLWDPTFYLEATVLLLADVAYIGLLLTSISHWYETIKSSPSP